MMNKSYKIKRIEELGHTVTIVNSVHNITYIKVVKNNRIITGTVNHVFKELFGY
jgi:hypothetical protein